jgi:hypothetical protein
MTRTRVPNRLLALAGAPALALALGLGAAAAPAPAHADGVCNEYRRGYSGYYLDGNGDLVAYDCRIKGSRGSPHDELEGIFLN